MNLFISTIIIIITFVSFSFGIKVESGNNVCKLTNLSLSNGTQNSNGECVETPLGEIPNIDNMVSTIVLFPKNNDVIEVNKSFTIRTKTIGLITGFFSDPVNQYYIFPQTLNNQGQIQGHSHVTVQKIESEDVPLDPKIFAFFKGLDDPVNEKGELVALVQNGLPAGKYRLCTMVSSFSHQSTLMPVAQRGAQDDCVRFEVKTNTDNSKQ